jgi:hypothetical protein
MLRQNLLVADDSELADREDALDTTWTWVYRPAYFTSPPSG